MNPADLVDALLARAQHEHPDVPEWSITLEQAESLLIPRHADKLFRTVGGAAGYYSGHVYRDMLIRGVPDWPSDWIALNSLTTSDAYYGHLTDGTIATSSPWRLES